LDHSVYTVCTVFRVNALYWSSTFYVIIIFIMVMYYIYTSLFAMKGSSRE